jgi:hypothetical protein
MNSSSPKDNSSCYQKCESSYQSCENSKDHGGACYVERAQCAYSCSGPP